MNLSNFTTKFYSRPIFLSVAINALIYFLLFLFFTPRFETVDDVILMMFSSGCLTSFPSEFLVYTSISISTLLKVLYSLNTGINWYPVYLYSINFISLTVILYVILKWQKNIFGVIMFLCLYFLFFLNFFIHLQYTVSSILIGSSGFFLFYYSLSYRGQNKRKWFFFVVAVLMVIFSGLIRLQSIKAVLLLSGLFLAVKFLQDRKYIVISFLVVSFLGYLCIEWGENRYYEKYSGIPKFKEFIESIENIEDNPNIIDDKLLEKVGLKPVDYHIIYSHFYVDSEVFTIDRIIQLGNIAFKPRSVSSALHELNVSKMAFFPGVVFILGMLLVTAPRDRKFIYYGLFVLFSVALALAFLKKLPNRVTIPITLFVVLYCVYYFLSSFSFENIKKVKLKSSLFIGVALFLISYKVYNFRRITGEIKRSKEDYAYGCSDLEKIGREGRILIIPGLERFFEGIPMFKDPKDYYGNNYIFTAWTIFTPAYNRMINKFGTDNLMTSLYRDEKFYVTGVKPEYITTFIKEHYNENVVAREVEGDFKLFKPIEISIDSK